MEAEELRFIDDALFLYIPLPQYGDNTCKAQLVMTKRIFQECYKRWIEPQVKTGNWIDTGYWIDTDNYYQRWKCSKCGCHTRDAEPPYCPNCGLKMEESEDKECI